MVLDAEAAGERRLAPERLEPLRVVASEMCPMGRNPVESPVSSSSTAYRSRE